MFWLGTDISLVRLIMDARKMYGELRARLGYLLFHWMWHRAVLFGLRNVSCDFRSTRERLCRQNEANTFWSSAFSWRMKCDWIRLKYNGFFKEKTSRLCCRCRCESTLIYFLGRTLIRLNSRRICFYKNYAGLLAFVLNCYYMWRKR